MTTIASTIIGRTIVQNSPTVAVSVPKNAPPGLYAVTLWVVDWFSREPANVPVYFEYMKERCTAGNAPVLPMDSTPFTLKVTPGTQIWVTSETNCMLSYAVEKVA